MKTLQHAILLTIALCAASAQASYSLAVNELNHTSTGTALVSAPGELATFNLSLSAGAGSQNSYFNISDSYFSLQYSGNGGSSWSPVGFISNPTISGLADGQLITSSASSFTVSWTPAIGRTLGDYRIISHISGDSVRGSFDGFASGTTLSYLNLEPAAVPEPTQAIAASMLLGCGGLVFVSRRYIKKQAQ